MSTYLNENRTLQVDLKDLLVSFVEPGPIIDIDGLNDFGQVVNGTLNTLLDVVRNRLCSLVDDQLLTAPINRIVNSIFRLVPEDLYLGPDFYIQGLLYSNPRYTPELMAVQLDMSF